MKLLKFILLVLPSMINNAVLCLEQSHKVFIYDQKNSAHSDTIKNMFNASHIPFEVTDRLNPDENNLYIIFNADSIDVALLPKNYIVYQTLDLNSNPLTSDYEQKLAQSVAIWDYSRANIQKYSSKIYHYCYLPANYEYADPVILPCLLPLSTLRNYKELLAYSNKLDTDISSHLPTMFYHTVMQNPKLILEAGVRGGESTLAFNEAIKYCNAEIIGIDMESQCAQPYSKILNSTFVCINDMDFQNYYNNSRFNQTPMDVVFIDTSHEYHHTMGEITIFAPLLSKNGIMMFHDSNVTPLNNNTGYIRLNGTYGSAHGNPRGVTHALKQYFSIAFNEHAYCNFNFVKNNATWQIIHYPFCNGLTVVKKIG